MKCLKLAIVNLLLLSRESTAQKLPGHRTVGGSIIDVDHAGNMETQYTELK